MSQNYSANWNCLSKFWGWLMCKVAKNAELDLHDKINNSGKELADANQKLGPEAVWRKSQRALQANSGK